MWLSKDSIEYIINNVYKYIHDDRLKYNIFTNLNKHVNDRIYTCFFMNYNLLLKMEEVYNLNDDMGLEYTVGMEINKLLNYCPYFVGTIAYLESNVTGKHVKPLSFKNVPDKYNVRYLLLQKMNGSNVDEYNSFSTHMRLFIQIAMGLHLAYRKIGFTHYNLHHGNVVVEWLDREVVITVDDLSIQTHAVPIIIDYGRSYTKNTGGHIMESKGVYPESCWQHDIYLYLCNTLGKSYPKELKKLLKFYNLHYNRNESLYRQLTVLRQQDPIYRTPKELLHFLEEKFSFVPIYNKKNIVVYKPSNVFHNGDVNIVKLKNPDDSDLSDMKKIIKKYK